MKGCLLFLLGLLALAYAIEDHSEETSREDGSDSSPESAPDSAPSVECSRMMCRMFCPLGFHLDKNGCPQCACIEDPCELMTCEAGEICLPAPHCTGFPCYSMKAECVAADMPCPMPMCANDCPAGYRKDARGCMTCQCAVDEPTVEEEPMSEEEELCASHPCPDAHTCVAVALSMCQMMGGTMCPKSAMCLPDMHGGMFLPHLPEMLSGEHGALPLTDVPDTLTSACKFRSAIAKKLTEEAKIKYGNSSLLGKLLTHGAMATPWCTDDGKFKPLQCHRADKACWCVNDRGQALTGSRTTIKSKSDIPTCVEHVTQTIKGSFMMQHQLGDVQSHLIKIASVLQDHLAQWMQLDHAQIVIRQVSETNGGLLEVHFEVSRSATNELHSAELLLSWHLGTKACTVPYADSTLVPISKSLKMQHHITEMSDIDDGMIADSWMIEDRLPDQGLRMREMKQGKGGVMAFYQHHKVAVIMGGVGVLIFLVFFVAVVVTLCKRCRVTSNYFKHKRLNEKSQNYKENLAFANDLYGKQNLKPEVEEEKAAEEEEKEEKEEATEA